MLFTVLLQVRSSSKSAKVKKGSSTPVVSLRAVLESTYAHPQIVTGLQWFLRKVVAKTALTKDDKEKAKLKKACKEATSMLITAGQNGPDA
jgi:nucleolar MIF4G domain-containing protein 1